MGPFVTSMIGFVANSICFFILGFWFSRYWYKKPARAVVAPKAKATPKMQFQPDPNNPNIWITDTRGVKQVQFIRTVN